MIATRLLAAQYLREAVSGVGLLVSWHTLAAASGAGTQRRGMQREALHSCARWYHGGPSGARALQHPTHLGWACSPAALPLRRSLGGCGGRNDFLLAIQFQGEGPWGRPAANLAIPESWATATLSPRPCLQGNHEQAIDVLKSGLQYMNTGPDAGRCWAAALGRRWRRCSRAAGRQPAAGQPFPGLCP